MKTAAIYARFSSELQKERSIDDQVAECRKYANREKFKIVATFADKAVSGASKVGRAGIVELMNAAKQRKFDAVIIEDFDRLTRDAADLHRDFARLNYLGIELHGIHAGKATAIDIGVRAIIISQFLEQLAHKVRRGHNGRVRDGKIPGAVTYGYRRVPGKPGEREIDKDQAAIVRRIFSEYAAGTSPRTIAAELNHDRVPAPGGGAIWNHQTFVGGRLKRGIISNPIYIGELTWNNSRTTPVNPDTGRKRKVVGNDEDRLSVPVPHLRIIDQRLWDAANKVRQDRASAKFGPGGRVQRQRAGAREHLLAGLLVCDVCKSRMRITQTSRDGGARVGCAAAHQHGTCDHRKSYDLNVLEAEVLEQFHVRLTDPEAIARLLKGYRDETTSLEQNAKDRGAILKAQQRNAVQLERIVDTIAEVGKSTALVEKYRALEIEKAALAERLRLVDNATAVVLLHPKAVSTFKANVARLHAALTGPRVPDQEALAAFRNLVDRIVVHRTGKRMPYEFTPHARIGALAGINLFPPTRSLAQAIETDAIPYCANRHPEKAGAPFANYDAVPLGRWKARAA